MDKTEFIEKWTKKLSKTDWGFTWQEWDKFKSDLDFLQLGILKKVAHFDMLKEIGVSVEDIAEMDYEDFEHIYLSLPSLIVKNIAEKFLELPELIDLLKDVKIKCKDVQELIDDKQIIIDYKKKRGGCSKRC